MIRGRASSMVLAFPLARVLFVLAIPVAIVLSHIRLLVFDPAYYQRGYERYGGGRATNMTTGQLAEATAQIQAFFRDGPPVSLVVEKEWGTEPLFNTREQLHMAEVRDLLRLALRVQEVSLAYLLVIAAYLLVVHRRGGARALARWLSAGSGLTLAVFTALGLLALADFGRFWTQFHLISFRTNLWMLDPRTDYLIRLFPAPFWFAAVLDVVLRSVGTALAVLLAAQAYLRLASRRRLEATFGSSGPRG